MTVSSATSQPNVTAPSSSIQEKQCSTPASPTSPHLFFCPVRERIPLDEHRYTDYQYPPLTAQAVTRAVHGSRHS